MEKILFIILLYATSVVGQPIGVFESVTDSDHQLYFDENDRLVDYFERDSSHGDLMAEIIGDDIPIHSISFSFFSDRDGFLNPKAFSKMLITAIDSLVIGGCRHILFAWGINAKSMRGYDPNNWEAWLNGIELTIRTKALEYNTVSFVIAAGNDGKDILKSINTPALINDIENVYVVGSKDEYSSRGNHLYYQDSTYKEHEGTSISAARYARVLYERHE